MPATAGRAARDRDRLRASEAAIASEVIEFQEARQRIGLRTLESVPPLSAREQEVLGLVAAGRADGEIATELFISKKTASVHVANVKAKLGAASRVEIAMLAVRLGLVDSDAGAREAVASTAIDRRARVVCPFKGLANFERADVPYFFGRERVVAKLVARLAGSAFVGLVGASGSGKSSILRAGLVPALEEGVLPDSERWLVSVLRPGPTPGVELQRAIASTLRKAGLPVPHDPATDTLMDGLPVGRRLVVVVDQFEEVFTLCRDEAERAAFIGKLVAIARDRDAGGVVALAVRSDFYGRCAEFRGLAELISSNHVLVGPMSADELARAVELPARAAGLRIDPELTAAIVRDVVDEPGGLPLLSTTLLDLWQRREGRTLRHATYLQVGGVSGAVSRLAEAAYGRLTPSQQVVARAVFLRLASGGSEGAPVVRRPAPIGEFDADHETDAAEVLATLTDSRLLTVSEGIVEISHEALLRDWPRLRHWLEEDADGRRLREHVSAAAREWDASGEDAAELYRGARLAAVLDWAAAHVVELNELERRFLDESRAAVELEAERQRRTNRRLRMLLAGAGIFLLMAVVAGGLAALQAGRAEGEAARAATEADRAAAEARRAGEAEELAERSAEVARARQLAASAITVLDEDPALSKLLALAATSIDDPPVETITALHAALATDDVVGRYEWPTDREPSTTLVTDLSPSGAHLVATGFWFDGPHDYLEVVARGSEEPLWTVDPQDPTLGVGYGFFTPDGGRIVYGVYREQAPPVGEDPALGEVGVYVRETATGTLLKHLDTGPCGAVVVAASASRAMIRTSEGAGCIRLTHDPAQPPIGAEVLDLESGARMVLSSDAVLSDVNALSTDGRWAAFGDKAGERPTPVLVDLETGRRQALGVDHPLVWDVNDDGSLVAIGDAPVHIWDVAAGTATALGETPADSGGTSYGEFGPDGRAFYTTSGGSQLRRWDAVTGEATGSWDGVHAGRPSASSDGLVLVGHWGTPTAVLIDTTVRSEVAAVATRELAEPSPEADLCETGRITDAGQLQVRGPRAVFHEYCLGRFQRFSGAQVPIATSIYVYDTSTADLRAMHGHAHASLSPDGRRLVVQENRVDGDAVLLGPMRIIDLDTSASVQLEGLCTFDSQRVDSVYTPIPRDPCRAFPEEPFALAARHTRWSPDGTMLAVHGAPEYWGVWDTRTGGLIRPGLGAVAMGRGVRTFDVSFTPDSRHLIVAVLDDDPVGELQRISTSSWQIERRRELAPPEYRLATIGYSADGSTLVAVSEYQRGGEAIHWIDVETLEPVRPPREQIHIGVVFAAAMNPARDLLATGSADGSLRVWNLAAGEVEHELSFAGRTVDGVAFLDDHHIAVLVADEGNLLVLTLDEDELLAIARSSLTRGFTGDECRRFNFEICPTLEQMRSD